MQKVVIGRELAGEPTFIVANQPTRGLDVGSIEFIHKQIVALRDAGAGTARADQTQHLLCQGIVRATLGGGFDDTSAHAACIGHADSDLGAADVHAGARAGHAVEVGQRGQRVRSRCWGHRLVSSGL